MDWNLFEGGVVLDTIDGDLRIDRPGEMASNSFGRLGIFRDYYDFTGLSSQYSTQTLAEKDEHPMEYSLLCGRPVEESCFEGILFPALPLEDSNESPFDTKPERLFPKSNRRALCECPCKCETLLLKLMLGFQEAGRLGPIENARRYTANLKKHLEDGNSSETLRHPITISRQHAWLVDNLFDASGGFLYCSQVVRKIFHLGSHRLDQLHPHIETDSLPKCKSAEDMSVSQDHSSGFQRLTVKHLLANKLVHLVVLPEEIKWRSDFKRVEAWLKTQAPTKLVLVHK